MGDNTRGSVLVVDDTHASLQLMVDILGSEGYSVRPADSGELALASAMADPPAAVVLDMMMPGIDGFEVLRQLHADPRTQAVPVIFATSSTDMARRVEALDMGAADYITKPFDRSELLARVSAQVHLAQLRELANRQADELSNAAERVEAESAGRKRSEERAVAAAKGDEDLANAAMALLDCRSREDVYQVMCDFMVLVAPDSVIIVNETDPNLETLVTRRVEGLGAGLLSKACELVGFEITGGRQPIDPAHRKDLLSVTLCTIPGGFEELASLAIPRVVARAVAKTFRLHDAYSIGIADSGELALANVQIYTRAKGVVLPTHLIESFAHQCYSTLDSIAKTQAIAEGAERNNLILRHMVEGLALHEIILDESGVPCDYRFLDVNPAFEAMTGLKADDILGRTVLEVLPGTERVWIERYGAVATTGVSANFVDYSGELGRYYEVTAYSPQAGEFVTVISDVTERSQAQASLLESEQRFEALFDRAPMGYQSLDDAGCFIEVNTAWLETLGYEREEVIGSWFGDFLAPEYVEPFRERFPLFKERGTIQSEFEMMRKDGQRCTIAFEGRIGHNPDGSFKQSHCILADITDRKRAEAALKNSELKYRTITENISDVVWVLDPQTLEILYISPSIERLRGFTPEEVLSEPFDAEMTPESARAVRVQIAKRLQDFESGVELPERVYHEEFEQPRKDGSMVWAEVVTCYRLNDVTGRPEVHGVTRDISERKRAEAVMLASEEKHQAILRTAIDGFWLADGQGFLREVNAAYCEMTGYSEQELLAMHISDLDATESPEETADRMRSFIESGGGRFETSQNRKDGSTFDVGVSVQYRSNDGGSYAVFVRDITERKQMEAALKSRILALTEPKQESGGLTFSDLFDIDDIQEIQDSFAASAGVASVITMPDGTPITRPSNYTHLCADVIQRTEKGRANCAASDASIGCQDPNSLVVRHCLGAGFLDAGTGIHAGGEHIATWLIAQVRDETQTDEELLAYADEIGVDRADFAAALAEIPVMPREQFERVARTLSTFARELSIIAYQNVQQARMISDRERAERELIDEQRRGTEQLERSLSSIVQIIGQVAETRDPYTAGHQRRVSELAVRIAQDIGLPVDQTEEIRVASLLHDIGKLSVPTEILSKPGKLTTIEFELIKVHSEAGYEIIASADMDGATAEIVRQHHERCDGSGYPRGLKADETLEAAKIIAVADVVEAMSSHRPYRAALGVELALEEIRAGSGTKYDMRVVEACLKLYREKAFEFSRD